MSKYPSKSFKSSRPHNARYFLPLHSLLTLVSEAHTISVFSDKTDNEEKQKKDLRLMEAAFGALGHTFQLTYSNMQDANNCGKWKVCRIFF